MKKMIFLGWLVLFFATTVCAQEKIEVPVWNVGDRWEFNREGPIEVVGVDKSGYSVKFSGNIFPKSTLGTAIVEKSSLNILFILEGDKRKKYAAHRRSILNFPFVIGKIWNGEFRRVSPDGFHGGNYQETFRILGWDDVVVQAGKFKAIKLEYKLGYGPSGLPTVSESKAWYWYSPDVKYFIKSQYEKGYKEEPIAWGKEDQPVGREDWELTSFKLKK